jgi:hypothetical protein
LRAEHFSDCLQPGARTLRNGALRVSSTSREFQLILPSGFVRRDHHAHVLQESNIKHPRIYGVFRPE